ncbi:UDP-glycosyltransferase 73E1-like [Phragmites australis]|uniref:UDP-glycosyltransferase 73E1-like n=1 Tax=Phragmites australis TaxID=29695 RepID=UPI002D78B273|nr:UDP-glycosyltransferase 73E1-like [Phragmites australis]
MSTMAPTEHALAAATTATPPPHFVTVPLAAQGHIIPLVGLARLLAERGARASVVTTPLNVARLRGVAEQAARAGLPLEFVGLPFQPPDAGLPLDCQNFDMLDDNSQFNPFFDALRELAGPFDAYVRALAPRPSCIISDWCNPWTAGVASGLGIPRLFFYGPSCFFSLCDLKATEHGLHERIAAGDDREQYVVPGVPVPVKVTKATAPGFLTHPGCEMFRYESIEAMRTADGVVVNTFLDLEAQFVACYETALGKPVWTVGPLSLVNRDLEATASLGKTVAVNQQAITAWLDEQAPDSVMYVSFGSIARKFSKQLFEVGHGLKDSGNPFLWVVKESEATSPEVQQWLHALEECTAGRGLVVRGWAPQLTVLSHRAVGGFVTHCGWNSLLEAIAHGVPVVTWPHFEDQFLNERLAVDVLGVGVPIGVTAPVFILDDEPVPVVRGDILRAVSALMGGGEEADERRRKAKEYGEKARRAMEKGGSSYENLTRLIESFVQSGVKEH